MPVKGSCRRFLIRAMRCLCTPVALWRFVVVVVQGNLFFLGILLGGLYSTVVVVVRSNFAGSFAPPSGKIAGI
jgi:hypothetical protein